MGRLLSRLIESLNRCDWTETAAPGPRRTDPQLLVALFEDLHRLLLDDDTSAIDLLVPLRANLSDDLSLARFEQLSKLVREYDYGSAVDVLKGLAVSLDIKLASGKDQ